MNKPTEAQIKRAVLEMETDFRKQIHAMMDAYLDSDNKGISTLHAIIGQVVGGGMGINVGVILIEPGATEIEDHAEKSGIEIVKA